MDTLEIVVLIGLCLKIALAVVALIIVYKMRLTSSNGIQELKQEGGQREESAREEKTKSRPVLKSSSRRGIHKRTVSAGKKPLSPGPAANEVRKQAQPNNTAPVKSSEPRAALKGQPVSHTEPTDAPRGQSAIPEPKSGEKPLQPGPAANEVRKQAQPNNTAPVKRSEPKATLKGDSVKHTAFVGAPQPQAAFTVSRSGGKPPHEPSADNTSGGKSNELSANAEPAKTSIEKSEASMDKGSGTEGNQASSEPTAATTDSGETDKEKTQSEKSGLGDLADLFATSASEFTEKSKLSEQVNEVDVNDILKEGLGLLGKVKKPDD